MFTSDCLSLLVYKEKRKGKEKGSGHKRERLNVTLEVGSAAGDQRLAASDLKCNATALVAVY